MPSDRPQCLFQSPSDYRKHSDRLSYPALENHLKVRARSQAIKGDYYTPNANMADHSVGARDEYESEASEAWVFCFDNASSEKSCFVDGLVCFISQCLRVFEFLNATRRE